MKKQIKGRYLKISQCQFPLPADKPLDYKEYACGIIISVDKISNDDAHEGDTIGGEPVVNLN
jgi:hypothetical protein